MDALVPAPTISFCTATSGEGDRGFCPAQDDGWCVTAVVRKNDFFLQRTHRYT